MDNKRAQTASCPSAIYERRKRHGKLKPLYCATIVSLVLFLKRPEGWRRVTW